jgi:serine protease AprX
MATDRPIQGSYAGQIDLEAAAGLGYVPSANRYITPSYLILALNRAGEDLSEWTRSSWSSATGELNATWARSSWSCLGCGALGAAIDPTRSSWSRSSWSSFGEGAEDEQAQQAAEQAAEQAAATAPAAPTPAPTATAPVAGVAP